MSASEIGGRVWAAFLGSLPNFLVLTVGGALVTFTFNYFAEKRQPRLEVARAEQANLVRIRSELQLLVNQRFVPLNRIALRLSDNDYPGARDIFDDEYQRSVSKWNVEKDNFYVPLFKLDENCKNRKKDQGLCVLHRFVFEGDANRFGPAEKTLSLHYAFRAAHEKLNSIMKSKYATCADLYSGRIQVKLNL